MPGTSGRLATCTRVRARMCVVFHVSCVRVSVCACVGVVALMCRRNCPPPPAVCILLLQLNSQMPAELTQAQGIHRVQG